MEHFASGIIAYYLVASSLFEMSNRVKSTNSYQEIIK